jgi:hypothetical protein
MARCECSWCWLQITKRIRTGFLDVDNSQYIFICGYEIFIWKNILGLERDTNMQLEGSNGGW